MAEAIVHVSLVRLVRGKLSVPEAIDDSSVHEALVRPCHVDGAPW